MADFFKMKRHSDTKQISLFCIFLCVLFVIWTGILLWSGTKQYLASGKLEEKLAEVLLEQGSTEIRKLESAGLESSMLYWLKKSFSQTGTLSYLMKNCSSLTKEEKEIEKIAALFSGKNAARVLWSGAAGKKAVENKIFQESDKIVQALATAEKEKGKNLEMAELEDVLKKKLTEKEKEKKNTDMDTPKEEVAIPTQSILLFQNGSPDITSKNKSSVSKQTVSESLLCDSEEKLKENLSMIEQLERSNSRSYLLRNFYITDSSTSIDNEIFQVEKLITMNLTVKKENKPQILIFHTHGGSEAFIDSKSGKKEDSIIGVGEKLAEILSEQYGYQVLHDKTEYDRINGKIDRNKAYNNAYAGLQKTLKKYPSIQIIIDLHRDGVGNAVHRTTKIAGKKTAQVMFFNGLSRTASGDIGYLQNDNLQGNLAFSLQLKLECMKRFENFAKPVYLKGYRYNMHLRKRFTLVELGNENNTVQEAKNAMAPLAMVIDAVLTGN